MYSLSSMSSDFTDTLHAPNYALKTVACRYPFEPWLVYIGKTILPIMIAERRNKTIEAVLTRLHAPRASTILIK